MLTVKAFSVVVRKTPPPAELHKASCSWCLKLSSADMLGLLGLDVLCIGGAFRWFGKV